MGDEKVPWGGAGVEGDRAARVGESAGREDAQSCTDDRPVPAVECAQRPRELQLQPVARSHIDGSPDSLRTAIQGANASGEDCTITLSAGTYTLTINNTNGHESAGAEGDLNITGSGNTTTIIGASASTTIVNANSIDRAFQVLGGANAVFEKLTIENGLAQDDGTDGATPGRREAEGGGILVQGGGNVTLTNLSLTGNRANGGGISISSGHSICSSSQTGAGGGLFLSSGSVDLTESTISGNSAVGGNQMGTANLRIGCSGNAAGEGSGGGIFVATGTIGVTDSSISANSAIGGEGEKGSQTTLGFREDGGTGGAAAGGGLFAMSGSLTLSESTLSGNNASGGSGGRGGHAVFSFPASGAGGGISSFIEPLGGGSGRRGAGGALHRFGKRDGNSVFSFG
jgi:hypothetical protein